MATLLVRGTGSFVFSRTFLRRPRKLWSAGRSFNRRYLTTTLGSTNARMKPRSSQNDKDVIDDPCWGDPEHCSLDHLLTLIDRNKTILHQTENFVWMHKPADLRMDGEYPATVHKLITYWYPPPSLKNHDNLLPHVATLHRHSDTPDKESQVRPCHQLDYATSGVLLLACNTKAANHAATCFEFRRVQKTYTAVLHGHVQPNEDWIVLPYTRVTAFLRQEEDAYKRLQHKKRRHAKANTFQGFQPPNAFCQIWQGRYARKVGASSKRKREKLSEEQWGEVDAALGLEEEDCVRMAPMPWKQVKTEPKLKDAMVRATECYNKFLKEIIDKERAQEEGDKDDDSLQELPTLFRVEGDDPHVFYIYLALAQVEDEFAMRVPNETPDAPSGLSTGDASKLNFKVALTQCTITNQATLNGQAVTKVHLKPRTGRRHQLRVHTAFLGHPIVGDQTYEGVDQKSANLSPRMCLHAYELGFPLPSEENGTKDTEEATKDSDAKLLRVTAPDPFPVSERGKLTVSPI